MTEWPEGFLAGGTEEDLTLSLTHKGLEAAGGEISFTVTTHEGGGFRVWRTDGVSDDTFEAYRLSLIR